MVHEGRALRRREDSASRRDVVRVEATKEMGGFSSRGVVDVRHSVNIPAVLLLHASEEKEEEEIRIMLNAMV